MSSIAAPHDAVAKPIENRESLRCVATNPAALRRARANPSAATRRTHRGGGAGVRARDTRLGRPCQAPRSPLHPADLLLEGLHRLLNGFGGRFAKALAALGTCLRRPMDAVGVMRQQRDAHRRPVPAGSDAIFAINDAELRCPCIRVSGAEINEGDRAWRWRLRAQRGKLITTRYAMTEADALKREPRRLGAGDDGRARTVDGGARHTRAAWRERGAPAATRGLGFSATQRTAARVSSQRSPGSISPGWPPCGLGAFGRPGSAWRFKAPTVPASCLAKAGSASTRRTPVGFRPPRIKPKGPREAPVGRTNRSSASVLPRAHP